ncbi:MAG: V4R domain-containing protein [Candidatus Bathyarchaeia archaeon]
MGQRLINKKEEERKLSRNLSLNVKEYSARILGICSWLQNERKEVLSSAGRLVAASEFNAVKAANLEEALTRIDAAYEHSGLGRLKIDGASKNKLIIRLYDCATCNTAKNDGHTYCWIDAGFIAGGLETMLHKGYDAIETKCRGTGYTYCEFIIVPSTSKPRRLRIVSNLEPRGMMPV